MIARYRRRESRLHRLLRPPLPLVPNPNESHLPQCEGPKIFLGGAGSKVARPFLNVDLVAFPGVHIVADVHDLPFSDGSIAQIECDAVLEHVRDPGRAVSECLRVLRPGGLLHIVVPFCHPFHEYPRDYRRWSIDGLRGLVSAFDVVDVGIRTGPTATVLAMILEYVKLVSPRPLKRPLYALFGWILWPARYLDRWLNQRPDAQVLANHVYALARKPYS
jgi:SAM-dependent methyltransferase